MSAQETYGPPPSASWDRLNRHGLAYQGDICGAVLLGDMSSFLDHASNYWLDDWKCHVAGRSAS
jgi:hypothetical protein